MFEAPNEKKETPIVSLNLFIDILKWFKGASELKKLWKFLFYLRRIRKKFRG